VKHDIAQLKEIIESLPNLSGEWYSDACNNYTQTASRNNQLKCFDGLLATSGVERHRNILPSVE
jgi:hypothetical protein